LHGSALSALLPTVPHLLRPPPSRWTLLASRQPYPPPVEEFQLVDGALPTRTGSWRKGEFEANFALAFPGVRVRVWSCQLVAYRSRGRQPHVRSVSAKPVVRAPRSEKVVNVAVSAQMASAASSPGRSSCSLLQQE